ncbi:hypothetical protein AA103196_1411 [Ameyamaea chiangmaiensis NBRC 103196]|uniref:Secreted protein n=1 Tax=Ameyamaea chiangmaiensis TaxID=442969 RepID=A0A850PDD8_9PROT|nr:hypothetical protein [Ameyamaea chiangmaiensis]MBS4075233.1 hypothetical protein [Ameyamaea chiangmaiensis]NVN42018.1 hypothetical protein [Ameyamaea chiangmaiensis]GBQ66485.1 hypothetical protein AA103196_1411 [Ameyamaea chiangmaiensis NBRC 103196]
MNKIVVSLCAVALASVSVAPQVRAQDVSNAPVVAQGGQQGPQMSPQQQARFRAEMTQAAAFPLPQDFMPRMARTMTEIRASNIQPPDSSQLTLDQTIAQVQGIPGLAPVLSRNGFSAHDFIVGLTAFGMALAVVNPQGQLPPGMPTPSPANVALLRAHPDQVQMLMQVLGGQAQ